MSKVTLAGSPIDVVGTFPQKGDVVADFTLVNSDLSDVSLSDFDGKRKVLNIFPSIDTGICATSVRVFNQKAADVANTVVLCISADLPFAQARFCGAEGIENAKVLSSFRHRDLHNKLGVDIISGPLAGLTSRSVIVLDENNKVLHSELVPEIKQEPDYEAALAVL
ncbi:TPA: thiol peroxidase [Mannheimia haemolytica]|uniref:thiol peroxidase n=1 Tax=Mannheimia haemolytica TaxID=75985 RepID=UPI00077E5F3C|nr:thiol peroxidase [Mannheimia haemolytica]KYL10894.1 peroxidase [Mannheimia haemolytica]UFK43332.1 thiol peroxidase [Mannheimia haemolytica]HDL1112988.1 thiol peroxidase [Mannheimia haemolytica]HDL1115507.1 thiol peroxidase [Mannheimia haemolytica]HDL1123608.1 thiol peroxidase [Mannheimia haemolytica]